MSAKEELLKIRAERETLSQKIRAMAGAVFAEEAKKLFEAQPKLQSFSWTQYTPYFNDGSACEFCANTDYIIVTDIGGNETEDISSWNIKRWTEKGTDWQGNPYTPSELELAGAAACEFLSEFLNEDFLMMFGDHTRVTVYRDGRVETDEYDHD
jgi:hypothetical protein